MKNHELIEQLIKAHVPAARMVDPRLIDYVAVIMDEEPEGQNSEELAVSKLVEDMYTFFLMNL